MAPGSIRVTRIFSGIISLRRVSANSATPPFEALYTLSPTALMCTLIEPTRIT